MQSHRRRSHRGRRKNERGWLLPSEASCRRHRRCRHLASALGCRVQLVRCHRVRAGSWPRVAGATPHRARPRWRSSSAAQCAWASHRLRRFQRRPARTRSPRCQRRGEQIHHHRRCWRSPAEERPGSRGRRCDPGSYPRMTWERLVERNTARMAATVSSGW